MISTENMNKVVFTDQAAEMLGMAQQTLRSWASSGRGPLKPVRFFAKGGRLRWRVADIERLLEAGGKA